MAKIQLIPSICGMRVVEFDYELPVELIAQKPAVRRDQSRLLVFDRSKGSVHHGAFSELPGWLRPGDVLVLNDSQVIPARMQGFKPSGGRIEVLLLEEVSQNEWMALFRPARRATVGTRLNFPGPEGSILLQAEVMQQLGDGEGRIRFFGPLDIMEALEVIGEVPLPPYIKRSSINAEPEDRSRYQTVFAKVPGSVAAPTAALHFTEDLLAQIAANGVRICCITLHVGLGTFAPVKSEHIKDHVMHSERFKVTEQTAAEITEAKFQGRRIVAVGTTTVRALETVAAKNNGKIAPEAGVTNLLIFPPFRFRTVDALLTNFHLPHSTLLMLVSAFASPGQVSGRETMLGLYAQAVENRYRFFSYGDAMLIV